MYPKDASEMIYFYSFFKKKVRLNNYLIELMARNNKELQWLNEHYFKSKISSEWLGLFCCFQGHIRGLLLPSIRIFVHLPSQAKRTTKSISNPTSSISIVINSSCRLQCYLYARSWHKVTWISEIDKWTE